MTAITLTQGQQTALESFVSFLADEEQQIFVLAGYSGTGKTTLVQALLDQLPNLIKTVRLLNSEIPEYTIALTATTNKAAETLGLITQRGAQTIHSYIGVRVEKDYSTGQTRLVTRNWEELPPELVFIDEASYVDRNLLDLIRRKLKGSKIVFIGDPAQLTPVNSTVTPVFNAGFPQATLTRVVRQAEGNPIIDLSTKFRETVNTGEFFSFKPDNQNIIYLDRDAFTNSIEKEFTRTDWEYHHSKILAWTNKTVIDFNKFIESKRKGDPNFHKGDYAISNKFIAYDGHKIKTDATVLITHVVDNVSDLDVPGKMYTLDNSISVFGPNLLLDRKNRIKQAQQEDDYEALQRIDTRWVDLRAAYACTINKAQGSTFDRVFIDLDDIRKCTNGNHIARMLYVAVSRARHQVFLTGDIA